MADKVIPTIQEKNSNVGIGTTDPVQKLTIAGGDIGIGFNQKLILRSDDVGASYLTYTNVGSQRTLLYGYYGIEFGTQHGAAINILQGRNVGIGTVTPSRKLEVFDADDWQGRFSYDDGRYLEVGYQGILATYGTNGNNMTVGTVSAASDAGHLRFKTINTERVRITNSGDVGIGTVTPSGTLHVYTADAGGHIPTNGSHDDLIIENNDNCGIQFSSPDTSYQYIAFGDTASANQGYVRYYHRDNEMVMRANGGDRLTVDGTGAKVVGTLRADVLNNQANSANIIYRSSTNTIVGNNADALVVQDGGNVGIGTDTPNQKFVVTARSNFDSQNQYYGSWIDGNTAGDSFFAVGQWYNVGGRMEASSTDLKIYTHNTDHDILLQADGGKVGIGTDAPAATLDIYGTNGTNAFNIIQGGESPFRYSTYLESTVSNTPVFRQGIYYNTTENATIAYCRGGSTVGGFLTFQTKTGAERMRIDSNGYVGIGTVTPAAELDVDGVIISKAYAFSSLPTKVAGMRAFINDSYYQMSSSYFGYGAANGGSYFAPVWTDGAYWYYG